MSTTAYRAALVREIEAAMRQVEIYFGPPPDEFEDRGYAVGQLEAYSKILLLLVGDDGLEAPSIKRPVTYAFDFNAAIALGHYAITNDNYLTVWLNDDPEDGYELHLDEGEWKWEEPSA